MRDPSGFWCSIVGHKMRPCKCGEQLMCRRCDTREDAPELDVVRPANAPDTWGGL